MALVHSRIRRLVYALPAPGGACGSAYRVHTIPSINHHYQVVRGLLRDEAAEALGLTGPARSPTSSRGEAGVSQQRSVC